MYIEYIILGRTEATFFYQENDNQIILLMYNYNIVLTFPIKWCGVPIYLPVQNGKYQFKSDKERSH